MVVTSKQWPERWLHTFVGLLCGRSNTCGTKINYKRQVSAAKAAIKFGQKVGREFDAYRCGFCGGWHIGGAQHLTFKKVLRIFWFWLTQ